MGKVTAVKMDVVTKKSGHQMTGMAVSVCTTPAAPSPIPIPYPTVGTVAEGITDPCLRTKINGAVVMTVGSCMSKCHGNEPGTLKEVVSLNTAGPCFPALGAPIVLMELGMAGITGSIGQMNKSITVGASGSASGAGGGAGGGGGGGGGGAGPGGGGPQGPAGGGGGGGGSNEGAAPPDAPAPPDAEGQATAGHPVDVITGAMFTGPIVDFTLMGFAWVRFTRSYSTSSVERQLGMGWGWSHSLHWTATTRGGDLVLVDPEGREARVPLPSDDAVILLPYGRAIRREGEALVLELSDGLERVLRRASGSRLYRLEELRDTDGHRVELAWEHGELVRIVDTVGRRAVCRREGPWRIWDVSVDEAEDRTHTRRLVSYEIDERGDLVTVVDAGGAETRYEYDEDHYLVAERRPDGLTWRFVHADVSGRKRCVETWGELPGEDVLSLLGAPPEASTARGVYHARLDYGPGRFETTVTDALGHVHRYWGNALGLVERYLDPLSVEHRYVYDARGNLLRHSNPIERVARRFDAFGRPVGVVASDGRGVAMQEVRLGEQRVSLPDGRSLIRRLQRGKEVELVDAAGLTTKTSYDEHGRKISIAAPNGVTDTLQYDGHGNLVSYAAGGAVWKYTWDLDGLPVALECPNGSRYEIRYGSRGEIAEVKTPSGQTALREFDGLGRVVALQHGSGGLSTWRYVADAAVEHVRPDGSIWRMGYDALLRLRWIANPAGERHIFDYDAVGNLVRERTFGGDVTEYEYDAARRVSRVRRGDGSSVTLTRDRDGRIIRRERSDGGHESIEYDRFGRVARAVNAQADVRFIRDERGLLVQESQEAGGWRFVVDYHHNELGQLIRRDYSSGWSVVTEVSQERGWVDALEVIAGEHRDAIVFERDASGRELVRRRRDAVGEIRTRHDAAGFPTAISVLGDGGRILRERSYAWDPTGPPHRISDSEGGTRTMVLDELGRPLRSKGLAIDEAFAYAPQGTPTASDGSWTVARAGRPIRIGATHLEWDTRGRLVARQSDRSEQSWAFRYDDDSRMTGAVRGDGLSLEYLYDALGRRLCATGGGTTTWFGWEGDCQVEEQNGTHVRRSVFAEDGFSPILESSSSAGWRLVAHDAAGTPWLYVDAAGGTSAIELSTWGGVAKSEGDPGPLRYAGHRADELTGLHYNRNRYYAPDLHVFTTPDPCGVLISPHDVGFVPNPSYWLDPLGLLTIVRAMDDPVVRSSADRIAAANPGARVVDASSLGSLADESDVIVVSHGSPGQIGWNGGRADGAKLSEALNAAGFDGKKPGARVAVAACNSATPGTSSPSVAQGVADGTGARSFGAMANDVGASQRNDRLPLSNGSTARPGSMVVGSDGRTAAVLDGQWVSTTPGGSPSPVGSGSMQLGGQTWGTGPILP